MSKIYTIVFIKILNLTTKTKLISIMNDELSIKLINDLSNTIIATDDKSDDKLINNDDSSDTSDSTDISDVIYDIDDNDNDNDNNNNDNNNRDDNNNDDNNNVENIENKITDNKISFKESENEILLKSNSCSFNEETSNDSSVKDILIRDRSDAISCRICLMDITDETQMCYPCKCNGTSKYVHIDCINNWRNSNGYNSHQYKYCMECNYQYNINSERKIEKRHIIFLKKIINNYILAGIIIQILCWMIGYELCQINYLKDYLYDNNQDEIDLYGNLRCITIPSWGFNTIYLLSILYLANHILYNNISQKPEIYMFICKLLLVYLTTMLFIYYNSTLTIFASVYIYGKMFNCNLDTYLSSMVVTDTLLNYDELDV